MKYHSLKMEEINRIVEELWKRTYQGTDVDTILIRSDNETGKGNRSYNYRVSSTPPRLGNKLIEMPGGHGQTRRRDGHARQMQRWSKGLGEHHHQIGSCRVLRNQLWSESSTTASCLNRSFVLP